MKTCAHISDWRAQAAEILVCNISDLEDIICYGKLDEDDVKFKLLQMEAEYLLPRSLDF